MLFQWDFGHIPSLMGRRECELVILLGTEAMLNYMQFEIFKKRDVEVQGNMYALQGAKPAIITPQVIFPAPPAAEASV